MEATMMREFVAACVTALVASVASLALIGAGLFARWRGRREAASG